MSVYNISFVSSNVGAWSAISSAISYLHIHLMYIVYSQVYICSVTIYICTSNVWTESWLSVFSNGVSCTRARRLIIDHLLNIYIDCLLYGLNLCTREMLCQRKIYEMRKFIENFKWIFLVQNRAQSRNFLVHKTLSLSFAIKRNYTYIMLYHIKSMQFMFSLLYTEYVCLGKVRHTTVNTI